MQLGGILALRLVAVGPRPRAGAAILQHCLWTRRMVKTWIGRLHAKRYSC